MTFTFKKPTLDDKQSTLAFANAYLSYYDETGIHGGAELARFDDSTFNEWLNYVYAPAGTNAFGYGKVGDETWLIYLENTVVGIVNIRYELTELLSKIGGHIGYSTHPDFQGQGIAKQALTHALQILKDKGVDRALLTCNDRNTGSAKVIESHGGELENTIKSGDQIIRRYWISL